jgi:diadenylate cyclase
MSLLLHWHGIVDFLVLAAAFYVLLRWAKQARALRIALGVLGLHAGALLARQFNLMITGWVLDAAAVITIVLLLVVFQPELRRAVMRVDSMLFLWPGPVILQTETYQAISEAVFELARAGLGALIVIRRRDSIDELVTRGISLGAEVSPQLLEAIFQKTSPLHDGAAIIKDDHIVATSAILPLTRREDIPSFYGTRHRAALGLAERSDAVAIVVSEERSEISLMEGRRVRRIEKGEELVRMLQLLQSRPRGKSRGLREIMSRIFVSNLRYKLAALGLAGLIWMMSFLIAGTTVTTVSVPVEFSNVPAGMQIAYQSNTRLEVQLRGSAWLMDSVSLTKLVANFDLSNAHAGRQSLRVDPGILDLPPGIVMERVSPDRLSVLLVRGKS